MFSLSPAAQEVLRQYREGMIVPQVLADLTETEVQELHQAEREFDAKEHAEWAGERLGELIKAHRESGQGIPRDLKFWAYKMLERKYLVQHDWQAHAYERALKVARARE